MTEETTAEDIVWKGSLQDYFAEAKVWYGRHFLLPYREFIHSLLLMLATLVAATILGQISQMESRIERTPFPMYNDDEVSYTFFIRPISDPNLSINESVAKYLLEQYVITRESYYPKLLEQNTWVEMLSKVSGMSSYRVLSDFMDYLNTQLNLDSPLLKYRLNGVRKIEIESITFSEANGVPSRALVHFTSTECRNNAIMSAAESRENAENCTRSMWEVSVTFGMSNVLQVLDTRTNFSFKVVSYTGTEIQK